jgi:hypothetical protein
VPVVGNFDPPVAGQTTAVAEPALFQNASNPLDVNADGVVAPNDALQVINELNAHGARPLVGSWSDAPGSYLDVNGDHEVSPLDALLVINELNLAAASSSSVQAVAATAAAPGSGTLISAASAALEGLQVAETLTVDATALARLDPPVSANDRSVGMAQAATAGRLSSDPPAAQPVGNEAHTVSTSAEALDASLADIAADIARVWHEDLGGAT